MDIYYRKSGERALRKVNIDKVTKIRTETGFFTYNEFLGIPKELKPLLLAMKEDEVLVIDNMQKNLSDGIYKDNYYSAHTKVITDYPKVFMPENPDFRPEEKAIRETFETFVSAQVSEHYVGKREEASAKGELFDPGEEELAHVENSIRNRHAATLQETLGKLKSYKELRVISLPTLVCGISGDEAFLIQDAKKLPERRMIDNSRDLYQLAKKFGHLSLIEESLMMFKNTASEQLEKKRERLGINYAGTFKGVVGEDNDLLSNPNLSVHGNTVPVFLASDKGRAVYEQNGAFLFESTRQRDARLPISSVLEETVEEAAPSAEVVAKPEALVETPEIPSVVNVNGKHYAGKLKHGIMHRLQL